jgi:serine/threonine protein kinase
LKLTCLPLYQYLNAAVFVEFHGWFASDDAMYLAMEYLPNGDLESVLQRIEKSGSKPSPEMWEESAQQVTRNILEGLEIMHSENFAHRDLKPQNVLVVRTEPEWWVKLGDFGLSKRRTDHTGFHTMAGTPRYMAPEMYHYVPGLSEETSDYTEAIDIWALGCIVYRFLTGKVPFPDLIDLQKHGRSPESRMASVIESPVSGKALNFIDSLLRPFPTYRPSAANALKSPWLIGSKLIKPNS